VSTTHGIPLAIPHASGDVGATLTVELAASAFADDQLYVSGVPAGAVIAVMSLTRSSTDGHESQTPDAQPAIPSGASMRSMAGLSRDRIAHATAHSAHSYSDPTVH
jgi:hypothetical protein